MSNPEWDNYSNTIGDDLVEKLREILDNLVKKYNRNDFEFQISFRLNPSNYKGVDFFDVNLIDKKNLLDGGLSAASLKTVISGILTSIKPITCDKLKQKITEDHLKYKESNFNELMNFANKYSEKYGLTKPILILTVSLKDHQYQVNIFDLCKSINNVPVFEGKVNFSLQRCIEELLQEVDIEKEILHKGRKYKLVENE